MKTMKIIALAAIALCAASCSQEEKGPDYVDLGLPSGTLWAKNNLGATSPEQPGLLFQWASTEGVDGAKNDSLENNDRYPFDLRKGKYVGDNYAFDKQSLTKYNTTDKKTTLDPEDDAAVAMLGADWRTPTKAQAQELFNKEYTIITDTLIDGKAVAKITSRSNGNFILLPQTGIGSGTSDCMQVNAKGNMETTYQLSEVDATYPYIKFTMDIDRSLSDEVRGDIGNCNRFMGHAVRPVYVGKKEENTNNSQK